MSDTINSTHFYLAIGKSREVMLLISESKKKKRLYSCIYLSQRAFQYQYYQSLR